MAHIFWGLLLLETSNSSSRFRPTALPAPLNHGRTCCGVLLMIEILHHPVCTTYCNCYHNSYSFAVSGHAEFLSSTVVRKGGGAWVNHDWVHGACAAVYLEFM